MPGLYRLVATWPAAPASDGATWMPESAIAGNQDIVDVPLDVRAGSDVANVVVTFTDRPTQLEGRLQDASGRPAADYFIIVFPTDERAWLERARRIVQTRPGNDGDYTVRGLPPGDYYVAALTDINRRLVRRRLSPSACADVHKDLAGRGRTKNAGLENRRIA